MASPLSIYLKRRVRISFRTNVIVAFVKPHPRNLSATDGNRVWHWELVGISVRDKWTYPNDGHGCFWIGKELLGKID